MEYTCHCIVHGKKYCSDFQYVMNFLRAKVSEKSDNFANASSIVCCCKHKDALEMEGKIQDCESKKKRETIENFFKESELKNAMESVLMMDSIPAKVKNVLNKWNNRSPDANGLVLYGNSRVAGILLLCFKGNRTLLQNPPVPADDQSNRYQLTLPIHTSMLGLYFGRNGRNVRSLCRKNKFVICSEERSLSASQASFKNAEITVVCRKERFAMAQMLLVAKAKEILKKRRANKFAKSRRVCGRTDSTDQ